MTARPGADRRSSPPRARSASASLGLVAGLAAAAPVDPLAARPGRGRRRRLGARRRRRRPRGAMFLSDHDCGVVAAGRARGRRRSRCWSRSPSARAIVALVAGAARGRPAARRRSGAYVAERRGPERAPGALRRAGAHQRAARGVAAARGAARGVAARAGLVGLPRPAHAAGRAAGDDRGARGRHGRRPGALPPADPRRGRPDGADGRRPLRAVPDPRRRAAAEPASRWRSATWSARRSPAPTRWPGPAACGSAAASSEGLVVTRRPGRAVAGGVQPGHQRDPAHPGRRRRSRSAAARSRDGVELSVSDECGGISEDDMDRVFDVAWRGSAGPYAGPRDAPVGRGRRAGAGHRQGHRRGAPRRRPGRERRDDRSVPLAAGSWCLAARPDRCAPACRRVIEHLFGLVSVHRCDAGRGSPQPDQARSGAVGGPL